MNRTFSRRKLRLSKETVAQLTDDALAGVAGGTLSGTICGSYVKNSCDYSCQSACCAGHVTLEYC